jgi:hypothetical protein
MKFYVSPMRAAISGDQMEVVRYLLTRLAPDEVNFTDERGQTLLHLVAWLGKLEIVKSLVLDHGADINIIDLQGHAPCCYAMQECRTEVVQFFLRHAAALGEKDDILDRLCKGPTDPVASVLFPFHIDLDNEPTALEMFSVGASRRY